MNRHNTEASFEECRAPRQNGVTDVEYVLLGAGGSTSGQKEMIARLGTR